MADQPTRAYLRTQVMTASPEMLQLMLWDGAIRFAEQGREAILKKDIEGSYTALMRAQKIITEMSTALRREVNPDLCDKLAGLYNFIYRRLVDANLQKNPQLVDDALEIMRHQRQTWVMLMEKLTQERAQEQPRPAIEPAAQELPEVEPIPAPAEATVRPAISTPLRRGYGSSAPRPVAAHATLSIEG